MGHIEEADRFAYRGVFLDHSTARVLQRHLPAGKIRELRTKSEVPIMQWRAQRRVVHDRQLIAPKVNG
jgi:hypothetical protein